MAATLRLHTLAKELGVPSKVVIEKCRAEGIELKNHMAAISVGLAESIREWFSSGDDVTSIEVAERVDVEKVRKKQRKGRKAAAETAAAPVEAPAAAAPVGDLTVPPQEVVEPTAAVPLVSPDTIPEHVGAATTVAEEACAASTPVVQAAAPAAEVAAPTVGPPGAEEAGATLAAAQVQVAPEVSHEAAATGVSVAAEGIPARAPEVEVTPQAVPPPPPEPIRPAGPQLVPARAELRGPRVIRIEAPEPERVSRPRTTITRTPGDRSGLPTAWPAAPTTPHRARGKARRSDEEELVTTRSRSPRRHGSAIDIDQRVREWRDQDLLERKERLASVTGHGLRDRRAAERRRQAVVQPSAPAVGRREPVSVTAPVSVKDFCAAVGAPFATVSKKLIEHTGRLWTINQTLDADLVELLGLDLGVAVTVAKAKTAYERLEEEFAARERLNLQPRPPVVAMLGHVDHGKTSLLDAIRRTQVAAGEPGGITQHIGAYRIDRGDWHVTFIDTPGHEAFTAMRARGANLTDVAVLVVAADDGVMPQTVEAIAHARAAGVTIVVALNKVDLPGIDLNRVYAQLAEHGLTPSQWGGETDVLLTSAVTGQGINELIAHLSTLSELLELKADPTVPAMANVIEAQIKEGRGVVAQVLVREGTLRPGQYVVCGPGSGRIRALRDSNGRLVDGATPGTPVEVSGLDELPAAGDRLYQVGSLSLAKEIASEVSQQRRAASLETVAKPRTLEALVRGEAEAERPTLNLILRTDVQGSVEVLRKALSELPTEKTRLNLLHAAVGAISEADVNLAKASNAMIIGFHVVAEERARQLAEQMGVEIRLYRVIYELLEDLQKALSGLLAPVQREEVRGTAEVREVFHLSRVGTVAGCYVTEGVLSRSHRVRVVRDGRVVIEGKAIASLRRFKEDAREVRAGLECGLKIQDFDDVKPHDIIQSFEVVEVAAQP